MHHSPQILRTMEKEIPSQGKIIVCYLCGRKFSINSISSHHSMCKKRLLQFNKDIVVPPEPTNPIPSKSSSSKEIRLYNREAIHIYTNPQEVIKKVQLRKTVKSPKRPGLQNNFGYRSGYIVDVYPTHEIKKCPEGRYGHTTMRVSDGKIMVFGGATSLNTPNSNILKWYTKSHKLTNTNKRTNRFVNSGHWRLQQTVALSKDMVEPTARSWTVGTYVDDQMFIYGGETVSGAILDDFWVFDIHYKQWVAVDIPRQPPMFESQSNDNMDEYEAEERDELPIFTNIPPPLVHHRSVTTPIYFNRHSKKSKKQWKPSQKNSKFIIYGGCTLTKLYQRIPINCIYEYTFETNEFLRYRGPPARYAHSMCYSEDSGEMVIFGGIGGSTGDQYLNDIWLYDVSDHTYEKIIIKHSRAQENQMNSSYSFATTEPSPRAHAGACVIDNRLFIIGGENADAERLNDIWQLDLKKHYWQRLSTTRKLRPCAAFSLTKIEKEHQFLILGGLGAGHHPKVYDEPILIQFPHALEDKTKKDEDEN
mmetsp:Transcript_14298/g.21610  ORF Transcript_14298/g.21610 Transcript_14298/m.21610 type:complete len:533 (+) Transcript_14298:179-1777(+)